MKEESHYTNDISMKYEILNGIIDSEIGGNFYLLNIDTGKYLKLNASGMFIYSFIKKNHNDEYIINQIVKKYNLSINDAKKDFNLFISLALRFKVIKLLND